MYYQLRHDSFKKMFVWWCYEKCDKIGYIDYKTVGFGTISLQDFIIIDSCFQDISLFRRSVIEFCNLAGLRIQENIPEHNKPGPYHHKTPVCPWSITMGYSLEGQPHLMPFVLPTEFCNSTHVKIRNIARVLIPRNCTIKEAASRVRNFVRGNICYALLPKNKLASETITSCVGMCTNIANLQCAILRAAGIPCGYTLVNIFKNAYVLHPAMMQATLNSMSNVTIHCFCSVWDRESGQFLHFDGTEPFPDTPNENKWLEENEYTGETQLKRMFLAGPFTPPQANIDHLLKYTFTKKNDFLKKQNENFLKYQRNTDTAEFGIAWAALYSNAIYEHDLIMSTL